jgi:hypothetical protein
VRERSVHGEVHPAPATIGGRFGNHLGVHHVIAGAAGKALDSGTRSRSRAIGIAALCEEQDSGGGHSELRDTNVAALRHLRRSED